MAGRIQSLAVKEKARVLIKEGQGVAIRAILGLKFAFEVGCPDGIGPLSGGRRTSRVARFASFSSLARESLSFDDIIDRGLGGKLKVGGDLAGLLSDFPAPP